MSVQKSKESIIGPICLRGKKTVTHNSVFHALFTNKLSFSVFKHCLCEAKLFQTLQCKAVSSESRAQPNNTQRPLCLTAAP